MKKDPTMIGAKSTSRRRAYQECSKCGIVRIAGQAFTPYTCKLCKEERMHPNTAIPTICPDCSKERDVCCRCGNPMD